MAAYKHSIKFKYPLQCEWNTLSVPSHQLIPEQCLALCSQNATQTPRHRMRKIENERIIVAKYWFKSIFYFIWLPPDFIAFGFFVSPILHNFLYARQTTVRILFQSIMIHRMHINMNGKKLAMQLKIDERTVLRFRSSNQVVSRVLFIASFWFINRIFRINSI